MLKKTLLFISTLILLSSFLIPLVSAAGLDPKFRPKNLPDIASDLGADPTEKSDAIVLFIGKVTSILLTIAGSIPSWP